MTQQAFEKLVDGISAVLLRVDYGNRSTLEQSLAFLQQIDSFLAAEGPDACRTPLLQDTLAQLGAAAQLTSPAPAQVQSLRQALESLTQLWYDSLKSWNRRATPTVASARKLELSEAADPALLAEFVSNTRLTGDDLEAHLHALRAGDVSALAPVRRILHTLKGEAGMLGIDELAGLMHAAETYLEVPAPCWEQADELFHVRDFVIDALQDYERGLLSQKPVDTVIARLADVASGRARRSAPAPTAGVAVAAVRQPTVHPTLAPQHTEPPPSLPTVWDSQELDLVAEFLNESQENLGTVDQTLLEIEQNGPDAERINRLFRAFHTLKGVASFLRLRQIVELSHNTETMLASVRSGTLPAEAGVIDLVFDATALLRALLAAVRTALENAEPLQKVAGIGDLVTRIKATTQGTVPQSQALPAQPGTKLGEILLEAGALSEHQLRNALENQRETGRRLGEQLIADGAVSAKVVAQALRGQSATSTTSTSTATKTREVLKVDLQRIDNLVESIGELVIVESMVSNAPEIRALPPHLRNYLGQFAKLTRELQELGMCMRMVPLRSEFQKMARMVRDLTRRTNKQVRVELRGENTEMDRSMVEQLADPLVHLIRNAVDHGIESQEERLAHGKSETGTLVLSAAHEGSSIVIEISDDGQGINRERVIQKALSQGLIQDGSNLSDSQVFDLLFMPGFSTADKVTEISGRGVGMDVVKRNIEAVRGRIITTSRPHRGTTFRLVLPLTLAIIDGMVIRCGSERFILPTLSTIESLQPTRDMLFSVMGQHELLLVRGRSLPLVRLGDLLEIPDTEPDPTKALVVLVESSLGQVAFLVDEVIMKHQVVIKTLGAEIDTGQLFAGAAILSNGHVGLILNVDSLVEVSTSLHSQTPAVVA